MCILPVQDITPERLEEKPIIFGDYMKMGAAKDDRMYEEIADFRKVTNVLTEVSRLISITCNCGTLHCTTLHYTALHYTTLH